MLLKDFSRTTSRMEKQEYPEPPVSLYLSCRRGLLKAIAQGGDEIMRIKDIFILVSYLLFVGQAIAADFTDLQIQTTTPGSTVKVEKMLDDDKVLLSVNDEQNKPVFGLIAKDFVITSGGRNAHITSAQPASESFDVPRNIVLVLDNSLSMTQRKAVEPLLAGVDELFKIVRPIDRVEVVVFSQKEKQKMAGRKLNVRTFSSNQVIELKNFVADSYSKEKTTTTTVLREAMLAGLELMRAMPENEPRFLVVFSDGEDINSTVGIEEVLQAAEAEGLEDIHAYGIDFMPGEGKDRFLTTFAEENNGEIWKATSETNLVPIFQSVASRMEYYYLVSFLFPPTGTLTASPTTLIIDEVENFDASKPGGGATAGSSIVRRIDSSTLTLRPTVDTDYGIARWKTTVENFTGILATTGAEGAPADEISVSLQTDDLEGLAAGGDINITMELEDNKGQVIELTAAPVKVSRVLTTGNLEISPTMLTIEEVKTIDSSPMLGYVYFAEGSSEIPAKYVRLSRGEETSSFDETSFGDTLEKYYQVLNIIGKRLVDNPETAIVITGCNADSGSEKGNMKLSAMRANAVRDYLLSVWGIAPERIRTEERNLPEKPSSSRIEEGKAENRRIEIRADGPEILAPIRSTYFATKVDSDILTLHTTINAPHGVARWTVMVENGNGIVGAASGEGEPAAEIQVPLSADKLNEMAAAGDITTRMEVEDSNGRKLIMAAAPITVNFIQTSQRLAEKKDYRIQEKYALILFDFDSDAISAGNRDIVSKIVSRMKKLPQATAEIVGHTDNIGKEEYNIKLSERRALAVHTLITESFGEDPGERIRHRGVGPHEPLYDNSTPEARAFNRTVTVTLEYTTAGEGPET
jgi:outer membrane protein OmpA-like peptidoglycan-associated protein/Mg-chelatase subunit ChlD